MELVLYAQRFHELSTLENGEPYRDVLQGLIDRTRDPEKVAKYEAELAMPPFPMALAYLWNSYWRIRRRKGAGMSGHSPVEWPDIDAFVRLGGERLTPWEVEIIEQLDDAFLAAQVVKSSEPVAVT